MGGHTQQSNAGPAAAIYDHPSNVGPAGDAGDAVMARWLQSAGLQHLGSSGIDQRLLPNLLMQGYGAQSMEEKQRLFKLMRNLNLNGESASDPYTPTAQSPGGIGSSDGFYSPEFRGDFGAGLLDLHSMDDTELLTEHVLSEEPFEVSPFMSGVNKAFDSDNDSLTHQQRAQPEADAAAGLPTRENNVAKIKVVVRKRPLNKKEIARKEDDIVTVSDNDGLTVHEPKLKVDLTAYVEKHEFCFDAVLDEHVTNDEVYRVTVEPIIPTIFQRTKATCFAYGQTGSGKTFTMQPLPLRAAEDLVRLLHQPIYRSQRFKLWLSFFEIYGGKLFDLLGDRRKLCMREDGRQQVCIVGLQEFEVSDVQIVKEYIERGNAARSTGSTGANEESSRSHAILQLVVKKHNEVKESRRNNDGNESKGGKVVGKISFIDLAGSERGADTTDNDRQTRKLCMREDGRQQVCIVGLQEFEVSDVQIVKEYIERGNAARSTGSTGANEESSRSHAILQLVVKKHNEVKESRRNNDGNESKGGKVVGKISFIDLAGSERGADTTDNDRQTRIEGAEINKSLLALKECIRALDNDQIHIPFRGSKLTEVLRDSFVGNSRTVMISCISPNAGSCEHTLNTLRYADRVKSLSKSGNTKKDQSANLIPPTIKEPSSVPTLAVSAGAGNSYEQSQESKILEVSRRAIEKESTSYDPSGDFDIQPSSFGSNLTVNGWETGANSAIPVGQKLYSATNLQSSAAVEDKVPKVSPPRRKVYRDEKPEKPERPGNWSRKDVSTIDSSSTSYRQQSTTTPTKSIGSRQNEVSSPPRRENINEILEEEEALIAAHRKEIEDTMEIVREEMKLLAEVDQPGSRIDNYVTQLSFVLSRKAASLVSLQARLARFQHRLKEQEILSRKRVPR